MLDAADDLATGTAVPVDEPERDDAVRTVRVQDSLADEIDDLSDDHRRAALREDGHSTRAIAGALGVSKDTVHRDTSAAVQDCTAAEPERVVGQDGKSYPARQPRPGPESALASPRHCSPEDLALGLAGASDESLFLEPKQPLRDGVTAAAAVVAPADLVDGDGAATLRDGVGEEPEHGARVIPGRRRPRRAVRQPRLVGVHARSPRPRSTQRRRRSRTNTCDHSCERCGRRRGGTSAIASFGLTGIPRRRPPRPAPRGVRGPGRDARIPRTTSTKPCGGSATRAPGVACRGLAPFALPPWRARRGRFPTERRRSWSTRRPRRRRWRSCRPPARRAVTGTALLRQPSSLSARSSESRLPLLHRRHTSRRKGGVGVGSLIAASRRDSSPASCSSPREGEHLGRRQLGLRLAPAAAPARRRRRRRRRAVARPPRRRRTPQLVRVRVLGRPAVLALDDPPHRLTRPNAHPSASLPFPPSMNHCRCAHARARVRYAYTRTAARPRRLVRGLDRPHVATIAPPGSHILGSPRVPDAASLTVAGRPSRSSGRIRHERQPTNAGLTYDVRRRRAHRSTLSGSRSGASAGSNSGTTMGRALERSDLDHADRVSEIGHDWLLLRGSRRRSPDGTRERTPAPAGYNGSRWCGGGPIARHARTLRPARDDRNRTRRTCVTSAPVCARRGNRKTRTVD